MQEYLQFSTASNRGQGDFFFPFLLNRISCGIFESIYTRAGPIIFCHYPYTTSFRGRPTSLESLLAFLYNRGKRVKTERTKAEIRQAALSRLLLYHIKG